MTQQRNLNTPTGGNVCMTQPTNADRARWAADALAVFTAETFSGDHPDTMHRGDLQCAIGDLIADLLHLADQNCFDPQRILEQAYAHFKAELLLDEEPDGGRLDRPAAAQPPARPESEK